MGEIAIELPVVAEGMGIADRRLNKVGRNRLVSARAEQTGPVAAEFGLNR